MFKIGDVVISKKKHKVKMTVVKSSKSSNVCKWFELINNIDFTGLKMEEFNNCDLILYNKYIREQKLNALIYEESRETINEI